MWMSSATKASHQAATASNVERNIAWYWWKFVHNLLVHPWLALPWEPRWAQRAHDWTAKRCLGGGR